MSLDTKLFFCRFSDGPRLHRRDVLDTIVARLPESEQRARIAREGAIRVALREFDWLLNEGGAKALLGPSVLASVLTVRRIGEAPVYLAPPIARLAASPAEAVGDGASARPDAYPGKLDVRASMAGSSPVAG